MYSEVSFFCYCYHFCKIVNSIKNLTLTLEFEFLSMSLDADCCVDMPLLHARVGVQGLHVHEQVGVPLPLEVLL